MSAAELHVVVTEAAGRLHLQTVVVEKDFRVCWILGRLFARPAWDAELVFKGGTVLSKVFGLIRRFSGDVDLSVSPATPGISESAVEGTGSRRHRDQWMDQLKAACGKRASRWLSVGNSFVYAQDWP